MAVGDAIGQMLPSAVGITISPVPLIAVILMLATPKGRTTGMAFTIGWTLSLAVAVTIVLLLGSHGSAAGTSEAPASWVSWLKLAFGGLFVAMAAEQFMGRPREGQSARTPGWMQAIDRFTPGRAFGLAVALAVVNPKNLALVITGALSIASSSAGSGGKITAAALMVLVASLCTTLPLTIYLVGGERSAQILEGWKSWMAAHNTSIMTTVLAILGAKYIGDAISALTS